MRRAAALGTALLVLGCFGKDPYAPGTGLGTFHVTGKLVASTCGDAPDPWTFDVKLATDPGTLYWIQGDAPVSGSLDAATHAATLSHSASDAVASDKSGGTVCTLQRDDALRAKLTPDPAAPGEYSDFTGTLAYSFSAAAGSADCSSQLAANGGTYKALPCSVSYTLTATRTALPNAYGK